MMYQSRCVVLLLLAACMFNPGGAEPTPALTGGYSGYNPGETSDDSLASYTGGNGGQNVDDILASFQQQISAGTINPAYTTPPQSHVYPSQGPTYSQYARPQSVGGTSTYSSPYSTSAGQGNFGMHLPSVWSTTTPMSSHVSGPLAPHFSGYPQQGQPSAGLVSQMNSRQGGDNSDNWVTKNDNSNTLPRSVIIPMTMKGNTLFAEMKVGQPGQTLLVEFDTGSSQLWLLPQSLCNKGGCRANAQPFNGLISETYVHDGSHHESRYGTGAVTGTYGIDTITLGEPGNQIVINNQKFGEAETTEGPMLSNSDAILGMGLVSREMLDPGDAEPFLDTMTKQYGTTLPFGFYYNSHDPQKSQMIFGEGYEQFIVGELNTHDVQLAPGKDKYDGWYVNFGGWVIESQTYQSAIPVTVDPKMLALVDTGASFIVGPEVIITNIKTIILTYVNLQDHVKDKTFPCPDVNWALQNLPKVSFYIDGIKYTIPPREYFTRMGDNCAALFQERDGTDHIILGRPFLNTYFSRFNHSEKTVQFALGK